MRKVLLVEDENLIRRGLLYKVDWAQVNCAIAGEAATGEEGLEKIRSLHPDIVITKYKIAVFCDGEFWHGKSMERYDVTTNVKYWHEKIKRNVERDLENTIELRDNGWIVLRFWETEIKKHLADCVAEVQRCIDARRSGAIRRTRN